MAEWPWRYRSRSKVNGRCTRHTVWVGIGSFSKVVATFNHVGGSFNLLMAITGDGWIIPSFQIWDYALHVEHISCVFTNGGQYQRAILSLEEKHYQKITIPIFKEMFFKILLFQVTFLVFFSIVIFSPYFLQAGLLLQYVALFQSGN